MAASRRKTLSEQEKIPDYAAIGEMLHDTRASYGLTLEQAAQALHVKPVIVQALEKGRLEDIPGGLVYAKGHLRSYAHYLGVNLATMLSLLTIETEVKPVASVSSSHSEPRRMRLAAMLSVGIILGLAFYLVSQGNGDKTEARLVKPVPQEYAQTLASSQPPGLASPCISVSEHPAWPPCFQAQEETLLRRLQSHRKLSTVLKVSQ